MKVLLNKVRQKTGKWQFVIVFGVLYIISQIVITSILHDLDPKQVLKLQTSLSTDLFCEIIHLWNNDGMLDLYKKHFFFDFPHPIWYSVVLISFISKIFNLNNTNTRFNYLILFPFFAGLLDLFENILHLIILSDINNISKQTVIISGIASNIKWVFLLISIVIMSAKYNIVKNNKS